MKQTITNTYPVAGMHCAACAASVERLLKRVPGIQAATVNLPAATVDVTYAPTPSIEADMQAAIGRAGFELIVSQADAYDEQQRMERAYSRSVARRCVAAWAAALPVFALGMTAWGMSHSWLLALLSLPSLLYAAAPHYRTAWRLLHIPSANMDTLVALSTLTAYTFSVAGTLMPSFWTLRGIEPPCFYEAATMITAFVLTGKWMEEQARLRTGRAISALRKLQPLTAIVLTPTGTEAERDIRTIVKGDMVRVRPGSQIPIDGTITEGRVAVDESMITGEPLPVGREAGQRVLAGTICVEGSCIVKASGRAAQTALAAIIEQVRRAQGSKAPVQRIVDGVTAVFVPAVLLIAALTFVGWLAVGGVACLPQALLCAVSVMVIACPCALGLATPTAITVGIGRGARQHIFIKDAATLENLRRTTIVVFDKTGTLTTGHPEVSACHATSGRELNQEALAPLLALESRSEHPLARSLAAHIEHQGVAPAPISAFRNTAGEGVEAQHEGQTCWAGNRSMALRHLDESGRDALARATAALPQADTHVFFGRDGNLTAAFALADSVKPEAAQAVACLHGMGLRVLMLTGDRQETAQAVATRVGISEVEAGLLPEGKVQAVNRLQAEGQRVAMVGDGINDSPALAAACCSIAMGTGTDIARSAAAITLANSDLRLVAEAIGLSRQTARIIWRGLFWACIYNVAAIPLAAGVFHPFTGWLLSPAIAAAAMAFSSVSVVANSLLLARR